MYRWVGVVEWVGVVVGGCAGGWARLHPDEGRLLHHVERGVEVRGGLVRGDPLEPRLADTADTQADRRGGSQRDPPAAANCGGGIQAADEAQQGGSAQESLALSLLRRRALSLGRRYSLKAGLRATIRSHRSDWLSWTPIDSAWGVGGRV